jgi:hypothetical protein
MWQGDEDKFTKVFPQGADGVLLGEVEYDDSTAMYSAQVSITIVDPDSKTAIGTLTVGLDAQALL